MKAAGQKFQDEIEVEEFWVVTEHGQFVFFSMLLGSGPLVFGLSGSMLYHLLLFC